MTRALCPDPTELLAYQDAELPPSRQAEVQLHVQQCRDCQASISQSTAVGDHIRVLVPTIEDREGLEALRHRLAALPPTDRVRRSSRLSFVAISASLALIATLGVSFITSRSAVEGGSTLARWIVSDNFVQRVTPDDYPQQPLVAPTGVTSPSNLPFALGQVGEEQREQGFVSRFYRAPDGLSVFFAAERHGSQTIGTPDDPNHWSIVTIGGREVLLVFGVPPDGVILIGWSDKDVVVTLLVLTQPDGGLSAEAALDIAAALMDEGVDVP